MGMGAAQGQQGVGCRWSRCGVGSERGRTPAGVELPRPPSAASRPQACMCASCFSQIGLQQSFVFLSHRSTGLQYSLRVSLTLICKALTQEHIVKIMEAEIKQVQVPRIELRLCQDVATASRSPLEPLQTFPNPDKIQKIRKIKIFHSYSPYQPLSAL